MFRFEIDEMAEKALLEFDLWRPMVPPSIAKTPTLKKLVTETLTQLLQPSLFEKLERRWGLLINVLLSKLLGNLGDLFLKP